MLTLLFGMFAFFWAAIFSVVGLSLFLVLLIPFLILHPVVPDRILHFQAGGWCCFARIVCSLLVLNAGMGVSLLRVSWDKVPDWAGAQGVGHGH